MSAGYVRLPAAPDLADVVEHHWVVTGPEAAEEIRAVLVPNGRATVQFCLAEPGWRLRPRGEPARNADVFLPVTTEPQVLVPVHRPPWCVRSTA